MKKGYDKDSKCYKCEITDKKDDENEIDFYDSDIFHILLKTRPEVYRSTLVSASLFYINWVTLVELH